MIVNEHVFDPMGYKIDAEASGSLEQFEKISDRKIKASARACLSALTEVCTPNFIYMKAYETLKTAKSPPVLSETVDWIHSSVVECGVGTVDMTPLIEACTACLESSNAAVRTNTVSGGRSPRRSACLRRSHTTDK